MTSKKKLKFIQFFLLIFAIIIIYITYYKKDLAIDEKIISKFVERMQLPNAKMAFMSTLLGLSNTQTITEKLQLLTIPTLVVWGENDPVIPIEYAQSFVSGINDCRFYKMTGCGHVPYVEKPKEFFQIVSDFLA